MVSKRHFPKRNLPCGMRELLAYQGFILSRPLNNLKAFSNSGVFFGSVSANLCGRVRLREGLLSPIFCDYLEAARASSPASSHHDGRFVAMCTARDASAQVFWKPCAMYHSAIAGLRCSCVSSWQGNWKTGEGYRDTMRHRSG